MLHFRVERRLCDELILALTGALREQFKGLFLLSFSLLTCSFEAKSVDSHLFGLFTLTKTIEDEILNILQQRQRFLWEILFFFLDVIIEQPPHLSCDPLEALTGSSVTAGSQHCFHHWPQISVQASLLGKLCWVEIKERVLFRSYYNHLSSLNVKLGLIRNSRY